MADWYYKGTKGLFGFDAACIKEVDGEYRFKTKPDDLTEEEKEQERWELWDGTSSELSCASLVIVNEFNCPLSLILTPGISFIDPLLTPYGPHMDSLWTPYGPLMDPFPSVSLVMNRMGIEENGGGSRTFCTGDGIGMGREFTSSGQICEK